jgi:hypothetical protein
MNDGIIRLVFSNNIAISNETFYDVRNIGFYSDISSSYYFFSNHSQIKPIFNEVGQNDSMVAFYLCDDDLSGLKKIDVGVTGDNLNFIIDGSRSANMNPSSITAIPKLLDKALPSIYLNGQFFAKSLDLNIDHLCKLISGKIGIDLGDAPQLAINTN